jgi:hypothetical protein
MPTAGGAADKLGNRYEALWAIDGLLSIIDGPYIDLTLEPIELDESRGIEFTLTTTDGATEYWSVKRQTARASGWTLNLLAELNERGRSILGDLFGHLEHGQSNRAVFASAVGAPVLDELHSHAATKEMFSGRLSQSKDLKTDVMLYLLPICNNDFDHARSLILRTTTNTTDERQLRGRINFAIRKLFYATDGTQIDIDGVRNCLADLLLDRIHQKVTRKDILAALSLHSVAVQDWSLQSPIRDRIDQLCRAYTGPLQEERINGAMLHLEGSEPLDQIPSEAKRLLVVGTGGGGKSTSLASLVDRVSAMGIPVIPVRFDQIPEGVSTTSELGHKLGLRESPSLVLAGLAAGGPAVLVIDQLDAVSFVSGRRAECWALFESLCDEVERYRNVSLVVGCREFDLEHDSRMRRLKGAESGFIVCHLKALSGEEVDNVLRAAGTSPSSIQPALKPILATPLHLALLLRLVPEARTGVHTRDELFDCYWADSERKFRERLGTTSSWTKVIDKLTEWLSENQELSAPKFVLDEFASEAGVLASQHFLVLNDGRYRFFHESLFDYAFARRFAARNGQLLDLLIASEQHLFRRAQVRQVLSFYRASKEQKYFQELGAVLGDARVRFHIKRFVLQWLSSIADPTQREWTVLQAATANRAELREHIISALAGNVGWFDVLDSVKFFEDALSSNDERRQNEAIWLMSFPGVVEHRPDRIAELVAAHRQSNERWTNLVLIIFRTGDVFHSRQLFEIFVALIDEGAFDSRGQSNRDVWWLLYSASETHPAYASEAMAHWFDRQLAAWRESDLAADSGDEISGQEWRSFKTTFQGNGQHGDVVGRAAAGAPAEFARLFLPRITGLIQETAKESEGNLKSDPFWSLRMFGESHWDVTQDIFEHLARALEAVARSSPKVLDPLLQPFYGDDCDSIAFLVLRAWSAAPQFFADRIADYLASDSRRLKIGYAAGSGRIFVSAEAVRVASAHCSPDRAARLELTILDFRDQWEDKYLPARGRKQLDLLSAFDVLRMSKKGLQRLHELQRKFPTARPDPPKGIQGGVVPSPIPTTAMDKMSDHQWIRAMQKHAGVTTRIDVEGDIVGGEHQIGIYLQSYAQKDPRRFIAMAQAMPEDLPHSYFELIANGVATAMGNDSMIVSAEDAALFVRRLHRLPGRPCGRVIGWLFQRASQLNWPEDTIDILAWYATEDPDPPADRPVRVAPSDDSSPKLDLYGAGINSARGSAAEGIGHLLFNKRDQYERLIPAIRSLARDRSLAVRSCSIVGLLACLNIDAQEAIALFNECLSGNPELLDTFYIRRFIHFAAFKDFEAIRPVLDAMLGTGRPGVVFNAAQEICLLSLDLEVPDQQLGSVAGGTTEMRKGAASVYAANVGHFRVGSTCRARLKQYFADPDDSVRVQAASAFEHVDELDTQAQSELLAAFLANKPGLLPLVPVLRALERSPVQLPDLVCAISETCVAACRNDAGNVASSSAAISMDLTKIVVRLYAQTEDEKIRSRCLSLIDEMERYSFVGLSNELQALDR